MNPGLGEEGGKVATSLIDSLKTQPGMLALVVFNIIFLVTVYFGLRDQRKQMETFREQVMSQQTKTMDMLYNCTPNLPRFPERSQ